MRSGIWQTTRKDGDSPVKMVLQGLGEKNRLKILDGLRRFIMVDNHEVVKLGDSEKNMESRIMSKPEFTADFLGSVVRERADELTLRAEEEGMLRTFIDTTDVGDNRWGPPLVDGDWNTICQAISKMGIRMGSRVLQLRGAAQSGKMKKKPERKQEGQGTLVRDRSDGQRNIFSRSGQRATDPNKIPSAAGSLCNPPEEPNCLRRRAETHGRWSRTGSLVEAKRECRHLFLHVLCQRIFISVLETPTVAAFALPPINDGLHQLGEG